MWIVTVVARDGLARPGRGVVLRVASGFAEAAAGCVLVALWCAALASAWAQGFGLVAAVGNACYVALFAKWKGRGLPFGAKVPAFLIWATAGLAAFGVSGGAAVNGPIGAWRGVGTAGFATLGIAGAMVGGGLARIGFRRMRYMLLAGGRAQADLWDALSLETAKGWLLKLPADLEPAKDALRRGADLGRMWPGCPPIWTEALERRRDDLLALAPPPRDEEGVRLGAEAWVRGCGTEAGLASLEAAGAEFDGGRGARLFALAVATEDWQMFGWEGDEVEACEKLGRMLLARGARFGEGMAEAGKALVEQGSGFDERQEAARLVRWFPQLAAESDAAELEDELNKELPAGREAQAARL